MKLTKRNLGIILGCTFVLVVVAVLFGVRNTSAADNRAEPSVPVAAASDTPVQLAPAATDPATVAPAPAAPLAPATPAPAAAAPTVPAPAAAPRSGIVSAGSSPVSLPCAAHANGVIGWLKPADPDPKDDVNYISPPKKNGSLTIDDKSMTAFSIKLPANCGAVAVFVPSIGDNKGKFLLLSRASEPYICMGNGPSTEVVCRLPLTKLFDKDHHELKGNFGIMVGTGGELHSLATVPHPLSHDALNNLLNVRHWLSVYGHVDDVTIKSKEDKND